ncbi:hypothetical protein K7X08_033724 [Anisodus acutangulus]|uniref:Uncharacterized protein n=1 Tax=Anisodus acutangulus TaxID=402998 RepID=A0A9Q1M3Q1_9SOLA|nr:hypothetical protein K7X08_033724 [Anisodus acutangulus]
MTSSPPNDGYSFPSFLDTALMKDFLGKRGLSEELDAPSNCAKARRLETVMEGLWAVFGEYEMLYNGVSSEQIIVSLCIGYAVTLFVGTFLGVLSDLIWDRGKTWNWFIGGNGKRSLLSPSGAVLVMVVIALIHVRQGWKEDPKSTIFKDYQTKFHTYIFNDKRIWLLSWAQASVHFSIGVFWILWAPTIVKTAWCILLL